MKLTIIVPHYNSKNTLGLLLSSIYDEVKDVLTIVVDDKSNIDNNSFGEYMGQYPNAVFLSNDSSKKGAGVCRNIGLSYLKTEWVMFADSDDYFLPGWYEVVSRYFDSCNDIVFFKPEGIRAKYFTDLVDYYFISAGTSEYALRWNYGVPWGKLYKSQMIISNSIYFDEIMWANDLLFAIKTGVNAKSIAVDQNKIYHIGEVQNSLSKNYSSEALMIRTDAFVRKIQYFKQNVDNRVFRKYYGGMIRLCCNMAKKSGIRQVQYVVLLSKQYDVPFFPNYRFLVFHCSKKIRLLFYSFSKQYKRIA